jgi:hypothetical protein
LTGYFRAYNNAGILISRIAPIPVTLAPHGRRELTVGDAYDPMYVGYIGYIVFESDLDAVAGYSKFYVEGRYRAAVPAISEINTGDIYISHIASDSRWETEISLVNTTSSKKDFTIEFDDGQVIGQSLDGNAHKKFTIRALLGGPLEEPQPDIYSAVIKGANGVIGLELFTNEAGNKMSGVLLNGDTSTRIYYPHTTNKNGWETGIVAYNPSDTECDINITPYTEDGLPLPAQSRSIIPRGKYIGAATVEDLNLPEDTAWFRIDATSPITGFELFARPNLLAGYGCVGISGKEGVFAKLEKDGWTGIAFVNIGDSAARISLTAYDDDGNDVAAETVVLDGHAKKVGVASALFKEDISGATHVTYSADEEIVGFQLNASSDDMMLDALPGM